MFSKCKENIHPKCVGFLLLFFDILQLLNGNNNNKFNFSNAFLKISVCRFTQLIQLYCNWWMSWSCRVMQLGGRLSFNNSVFLRLDQIWRICYWNCLNILVLSFFIWQVVYLSQERTGRKEEEGCAAAPPFLRDWNSWVCTAQCVLVGEFLSEGTSTNDLLPSASHKICSQVCFFGATWMWCVLNSFENHSPIYLEKQNSWVHLPLFMK